MDIKKLVVLPAVAAALMAAGAIAEESTATIKGIYLDGAKPGQPGPAAAPAGRLGVKFNVKLDRNGQGKMVQSDYDFEDGDRMKFQFEVNRESYVYVLHRTLNGDPNRLKGIDIEHDAPAAGTTPYRLLFPTQETGRNNKLAARHVYTVPTGQVSFTLDRDPGVEKLYLVVSPRPLEITRYFNVENGKLQRPGRDDSEDDVNRQLSKELKGLSGNAETALAKKGINVEPDSYAVSRNGNQPMIVEVNLRHYPRGAR